MSEEPTRKMVAELGKAGWRKVRTSGSHSMWVCLTGVHTLTVPDGHRTISPGVVRKIRAALSSCTCTSRSTA